MASGCSDIVAGAGEDVRDSRGLVNNIGACSVWEVVEVGGRGWWIFGGFIIGVVRATSDRLNAGRDSRKRVGIDRCWR